MTGPCLCFSPDGAQLAAIAPYDKALHVWDLRRIRDHLAEMHLEGDWPAYPPAPPPAPALRIRQDAPGIAGPRPVAAPPPVVVLPPLNPKHREATPQQIQDWIHQLGGDDAKASAEAAAALVDVGPPALAALKQAVAGPDAGLARRAAEVGDRIEVAEALAPTPRPPETSGRLDRRGRRRPDQTVRRSRGLRRPCPERQPAEKDYFGAGQYALLGSDRPPVRRRRPDLPDQLRPRACS